MSSSSSSSYQVNTQANAQLQQLITHCDRLRQNIRRLVEAADPKTLGIVPEDLNRHGKAAAVAATIASGVDHVGIENACSKAHISVSNIILSIQVLLDLVYKLKRATLSHSFNDEGAVASLIHRRRVASDTSVTLQRQLSSISDSVRFLSSRMHELHMLAADVCDPGPAVPDARLEAISRLLHLRPGEERPGPHPSPAPPSTCITSTATATASPEDEPVDLTGDGSPAGPASLGTLAGGSLATTPLAMSEGEPEEPGTGPEPAGSRDALAPTSAPASAPASGPVSPSGGASPVQGNPPPVGGETPTPGAGASSSPAAPPSGPPASDVPMGVAPGDGDDSEFEDAGPGDAAPMTIEYE
ncbi:hypothetical protein H696_04726 [Fonticula alba]|uniref:Uncharacterized protein n=1 Tax=Fonticula alba TaxID=691883 RepID=A0A058Z4J8_FONAL|nr:hypothetical protein H696_04726 [Fonticula alba]KCV68432.1 hypothetical protein H696_04726 [Fonticula alba]|eukprot:XP_009496864.1 hypothetical protein H696_04726 [Fonticula alba]